MNNRSKAFMKEYEELVFSDDFMFGKTMEDPELCRELLECLLQRPVGELKEIQEQKELRFTADGKRIRLDVYSMEDNGILYDTEMQNLNRKKVEDLELPNRCRFYQASIDMDFLNKNEAYKLLPESHIIFICTFDPFGLGLSQYTFREQCSECAELTLGDLTEKHFYNCAYSGNEIAEDMMQLYRYIQTGKAGNTLTKRIDAAVNKCRQNEEWRSSYMKERVLLWEAREEGRIEECRNTNRERERADRERQRADAAEARVKELEALLAAK